MEEQSVKQTTSSLIRNGEDLCKTSKLGEELMWAAITP